MKKRILSGIRATGQLHLGNYLGMVKGMLEQQEKGEYEIFFMVADVHAITTPFDPELLRKSRREVVIDYLSTGLDPEKSVVFMQSDVPEHTELSAYLSSVMSIARMQHLPTFKEKVKQYPDQASMALLNYPILMAADILAYKSDLVPTGVDQKPHLEVAREMARKMNSRFGMDFPEPKRFATEGEYVPSLTGEGKMSKSVEGSYINLNDDLETIKEKLAKTPTDAGKSVDGEKPSGGVEALFSLVELFQGKERRSDYLSLYMKGDGVRYGDLKNDLAEAIYEELKPIQEKRRELEDKPEYVDRVIEEGAEKASKTARKTVDEVKERMGLL